LDSVTGKPLLWIPLSFNHNQMSVATYSKLVGKLVYVKRAFGKPLLVNGAPQVHLLKKFHLEATATAVAARESASYDEMMCER
jgi:hypothetical protein